jgi:hypothetical protein
MSRFDPASSPGKSAGPRREKPACVFLATPARQIPPPVPCFTYRRKTKIAPELNIEHRKFPPSLKLVPPLKLWRHAGGGHARLPTTNFRLPTTLSRLPTIPCPLRICISLIHRRTNIFCQVTRVIFRPYTIRMSGPDLLISTFFSSAVTMSFCHKNQF